MSHAFLAAVIMQATWISHAIMIIKCMALVLHKPLVKFNAVVCLLGALIQCFTRLVIYMGFFYVGKKQYSVQYITNIPY